MVVMKYLEGFKSFRRGQEENGGEREERPASDAGARQEEAEGFSAPVQAEAASLDAGTVGYINELLRLGVERRASDIELVEGRPPYFRIYRETRMDPSLPEVSGDAIRAILDQKQLEALERDRDIDFSYPVPGVGRFRVNVYYDREGLVAVFRAIPEEVPDFRTLGLPEYLLNYADLKNGLILVTGPTGSGKSTTLAAMIRHINETRPVKIVTLEDPIEYVHHPIKARISQREVGSSVKDFHRGLRAALRQAPDVILVGEMRDRESIEMALTAAETGHLVMSTLHTRSAGETAQRIVDAFPEEARPTVRAQLAATLALVVVQQLVPRKDRKGLALAYEILIANTAVRTAIREGKYQDIRNAIETGRQEGMVSMNQSLAALVMDEIISVETAQAHTTDVKDLMRLLGKSPL